MKKILLLLPLLALFLAVGLVAQGPLTPLMNLRTRTDANGYLLVTSGAYTGPDGPLTAMANLRGRTDSNGYVMMTLGPVTIKTDTPTIASGFGTSPSIITGSTDFGGAVDVGTGGVATGGVINFAGTAYPSAPFCVASTGQSNNFPMNVNTTTTQMTFLSGAAIPASIRINWICVGAK